MHSSIRYPSSMEKQIKTHINSMYTHGINAYKNQTGRIMGIGVVVVEAICNVLIRPVAAIECLAKAVLNTSQKHSLSAANYLAQAVFFGLDTVPALLFAIPSCAVQFVVVMIDPKLARPWHAESRFMKNNLNL